MEKTVNLDYTFDRDASLGGKVTGFKLILNYETKPEYKVYPHTLEGLREAVKEFEELRTFRGYSKGYINDVDDKIWFYFDTYGDIDQAIQTVFNQSK